MDEMGPMYRSWINLMMLAAESQQVMWLRTMQLVHLMRPITTIFPVVARTFRFTGYLAPCFRAVNAWYLPPHFMTRILR